jgi:hypothetical protein
MKMVHKVIIGTCLALGVIGLTGCSNPHKEAARAATAASNAEADVSKQKAQILEDYRKCVKNNPSDQKACEGYKSALDTM